MMHKHLLVLCCFSGEWPCSSRV